MISRFGLIDYGMGNIQSMKNAFDYLAIKNVITRDPKILADVDKIILPLIHYFLWLAIYAPRDSKSYFTRPPPVRPAVAAAGVVVVVVLGV